MGKLVTVVELLEAGIPINTATESQNPLYDRMTALHCASYHGHRDVVQALLSKRAKIDAKTANGATPLMIAAKKGHVGIVFDLLRKRASVNASMTSEDPVFDRMTALHFASFYNHIEIVRTLLNNNAKINAKTTSGLTPLMFSAQAGHLVVLLELLNKGASVHATVKSKHLADNRKTALHLAAKQKNSAIAQALLNRNAMIDAPTSDGTTPLMIASRKGNLEVAVELLNKGAFVNTTVSSDDPLFDGLTALHHASYQGHLKIVQTLLERGAKIDAETSNGITPLMFSVPNGRFDVLLELLNAGASVKAMVKSDDPAIDQMTALHFACRDGHANSARELLERGADIYAKTREGKTPWDYVQDERKFDFLQTSHTVLNDLSENTSTPTKSKAISHIDTEVYQATIDSTVPLVDTNKGLKQGRRYSKDFLNKMNSLQAGEKIGDYTILRGSGNRVLHIKVAEHYLRPGEVILKFFTSQLHYQNALQLHIKLRKTKHVCKLYDAYDDHLCLVFEQGSMTMDEWKKDPDRNWMHRKTALNDVAEALQEIHEAGVVHCDIKPSNIMFFANDMIWKLIDFDNATAVDTNSRLTFTLRYAAPEIIDNIFAGNSDTVWRTTVDIWAFGVIAYEICTGVDSFYGKLLNKCIRHPEADEGVDFLTLKQCQTPNAVAEKLAPEANKPYHKLLDYTLRIDPSERWNALEILDNRLFRSDANTTVGSNEK